ncbi:FHA domain-containing protein FhaB/FipA [Bifidobacterium choloepi]|uniref:FHA domain-containing protein n=1 Tax=Bifidobacterium choloepi TaxID=2614131 RepID=A0A6I5N321_9BIFI|nr:FHA domain-containing protein [Bifidobacterium choloepi]NEG70585.1 FHA domain-containing protein [Bifidobacterium choloepi]
MITELTFTALKYGFLILLWVFVWLTVRSLYRDVEVFSPHKSRARRRKDRQARKTAQSPAPSARPARASKMPPTGDMPSAPAPVRAAAKANAATAPGGPSLLVIIDGPLAGTSVPLNDGASITLGRAASNTVVLDDEFVSSHHARVYRDPASQSWAIEDLNSTNGTIVNQQRISAPTMLAPRIPVRIGATTFELR